MNPAIAPAVAALEAERLAPVPRAHRVAAVDVDDLALVLDAAGADVNWRGARSDVAAAFGRLEMAVRKSAA